MKAVPVAEVFGPTIQGEGPAAGMPCHFVRFGGCDYQCSWCDSLHAVLPEHVRKLERLDVDGIMRKLLALPGLPEIVVLSGGNPALHELGPLVERLQAEGFYAHVETQGSRWKDWLTACDLVVCSPKPPSSGMVTDWDALERVVRADGLRWKPGQFAFKVVVGDDADYAFAKDVHQRWPHVPFSVSVLNPDGSGDHFDVLGILARYRALCERVSTDADMNQIRVLPQMHTLAWGNAKGV